MLTVDWRDGPAAKTEDLDWVPNTHRVAQSHLSLELQGCDVLFGPMWGNRHTRGAHAYIQELKHTQNKMTNF